MGLRFDNGDFRGNSYVTLPEMKEGDKFKILYTIEDIGIMILMN